MASFRKIYILVSAALLISAVFVIFISTPLFNRSANNATTTVLDSSKFVTIERPVFKYGLKVNNLELKGGYVKHNQKFADLLEGSFVKSEIMNQLTLLPRGVFDFKKITASKKYTLIHQPDSLKTAIALVYEPNPVEYVVFHLKDSLVVENHEREIITEEKSVTGVITTSLYETIDAMNISRELTNKFVDVFGWQVDFQHLQRGDRFKLIYEENSVEGQPYSIGRVLGIYFEHLGNGYYAFPFDQGDGVDFFDEEGKSLRKALLKYPIEFTRISSRYSFNRFHPVAKVYRAHLGTDFAAAKGTPIRSVGDGVVLEARYTSSNGNYVKIRHNGTYATGYLHMSKIAPGVRAGTHVSQGQTIGYVGSTGLATGPHLCYRFWRNGAQVDALRVDLPPAKPVEKKNWKHFDDVMALTALKLQSIPFENEPVIVASR
ncbi:MAG: peptidoglycan DD-metalloendopeptidase family protein [Bacteroidetes bacterium]|nr:peptidoglycan DD-metalloendopeptidase family protein [Bacteroidota bacterium]